MNTKSIEHLWLEFDDTQKVGSWSLPDPNDPDPVKAKKFIRMSEDIGWHICYAVACGAKKVTLHFEEMPDATR